MAKDKIGYLVTCVMDDGREVPQFVPHDAPNSGITKYNGKFMVSMLKKAYQVVPEIKKVKVEPMSKAVYDSRFPGAADG